MSTGSPAAVADERGPSLMTRVAAVAVVVALAALAAYTMFSGPTTVPAPAGGGATKAAPGKAAPAGEEQFPEREGGGGG
jgi:hypothetical protein